MNRIKVDQDEFEKYSKNVPLEKDGFCFGCVLEDARRVIKGGRDFGIRVEKMSSDSNNANNDNFFRRITLYQTQFNCKQNISILERHIIQGAPKPDNITKEGTKRYYPPIEIENFMATLPEVVKNSQVIGLSLIDGEMVSGHIISVTIKKGKDGVATFDILDPNFSKVYDLSEEELTIELRKLFECYSDLEFEQVYNLEGLVKAYGLHASKEMKCLKVVFLNTDDVRVARYLIEKEGFNVHGRNGREPLLKAINDSNFEMVELLLKKGAEVTPSMFRYVKDDGIKSLLEKKFQEQKEEIDQVRNYNLFSFLSK